MASEKVYVGKAGAQELYRRVEEHIDARIPKVPGAEGNVGKFTEDGSLEDTGVSAAELESAVRDDHTHENKEVLDATTAAYTTEEQEKLGNIETGAEVNAIVTVKVDGTALTPGEDRAVDIDLSGKVNVEPGKGLSSNDYTTPEKEKLGGIAEGAQVNVIEAVQVAGTDLQVNEKKVNIPDAGTSTKGVVKLTSDIESADVNAAITPAAVKEALRHVGGYKVANRGQDGKPDVPLADRSPNYIYLTEVPNTPEPDHYEEWIWSPGDQSVEAKWVLIGTTTVDLTDYVRKVDGAVEGNLASLTAGGYMGNSGIAGTDVSDAVSKKHSHDNKATLDRVEEPYTTAEKTKLAGISNYVESASVSGRTLTLTPKTGEAVTFSDTGDVNVIEEVQVNGTALSVDLKSVNIPAASGNADGVVNGTDVTRWNSWDYASYEVPLTGVTINGRKYPVVKIGNLLWMAENLDYRWTGLATSYDYGSSTVPRANYYDNDSATYGENGNKYGLLYNRPAAKYLEDNKTELGIPAGWRVPTSTDISALLNVAGTGGAKIKSIDGWDDEESAGTNETGFNLYPTGRRYSNSFDYIGRMSILWTCTDSESGYYPTLYIDGNQCMGGSQKPEHQYGIRLVKTLS